MRRRKEKLNPSSRFERHGKFVCNLIRQLHKVKWILNPHNRFERHGGYSVLLEEIRNKKIILPQRREGAKINRTQLVAVSSLADFCCVESV